MDDRSLIVIVIGWTAICLSLHFAGTNIRAGMDRIADALNDVGEIMDESLAQGAGPSAAAGKEEGVGNAE